MTDLIRTFTPDLEIRSSAKGGDGRTVVGIAVPYSRPQRINDQLTEQFAPGAFRRQMKAPNRIPFTRDHMAHGGRLIGKTLLLRDDAKGLYGEWRVSATPAGDETLELLKDGVLSELSIGFREGQNRRLQGGVVERASAELREVSVVMEGAYGRGATVSEVRTIHDFEARDIGCTCGAVDNMQRARQILAHWPVLPA